MSLEDFLDDNVDDEDRALDLDDVTCPNCQGDELSKMNKGIVQCENENCAVYNFDPR